MLVANLLLCFTTSALAQQRRLDQDPALDNLEHPPGYAAAEPGQLGGVQKVGQGPRDMILIPGAGFSGEIYEGFMASRVDTYTMYAVTLPGFGGTAAPPMPAAGTSYGDQSWTRAATDAIARLITDEGLDRPVLVAHWLLAPQIALRLALEHPDRIAAVVVIAGVAHGITPAGAPEPQSLAARVGMVDQFLAPRWFKTVTRDTWDDNNYYPGDYARHPVRALQLWRMAAEPTLPTWVRYLCESWAQDITLDLGGLTVPTLLVQPEFDSDFYFDPANDYMRGFVHGTWDGVEELSDQISVAAVKDSRVFIMDDQPEELDRVVEAFLVDLPAR